MLRRDENGGIVNAFGARNAMFGGVVDRVFRWEGLEEWRGMMDITL